MPSVAARDAAIHDLRVAETGLQRQHLRHHQRAHADGIGGHDILEYHAFRPGELAADRREIIAHLGGLDFRFERLRVRFGEKIRQRAGEKIHDLLLPAAFEMLHRPQVGGVGCEPGLDGFGGGGEFVRVVGIHPHVKIKPVNLPELAERVLVFVHELVVLRQGRQNVFLQINPQRNQKGGDRQHQGAQQHRPAMGYEPEIETRVEIRFHYLCGTGARLVPSRAPKPGSTPAPGVAERAPRSALRSVLGESDAQTFACASRFSARARKTAPGAGALPVLFWISRSRFQFSALSRLPGSRRQMRAAT